MFSLEELFSLLRSNVFDDRIVLRDLDSYGDAAGLDPPKAFDVAQIDENFSSLCLNCNLIGFLNLHSAVDGAELSLKIVF